MLLLVCAANRVKDKMKGGLGSPSSPPRELQLSPLPPTSFPTTEDNVLYHLNHLCGDDLEVPRVAQHEVVRGKFLGHGAFGEVFEGRMRGERVAIKMLRKGASEAERREFLQEAQLMSHFQHPHILRLLAVCTQPFLLLLELMEGGDLLSHLRASRPANGGQGLRVEDMLAMCVDVAKGCSYLEDLHFVHRDLAARNCLVSTGDPRSRVVKIGDFGLARDIYKSDYYRKEVGWWYC
ncbi:leukocyte tyrosine kinase receptor-like [Hyalella azteca]|uniref:Tyrosine-protein kinase receptor n=1 Tax=Hyalella azteca TaxID=294128 RepID=A0A8B7N9K4_HYAAZ|nr:leukocyte tyrosine kinase receptor-like [Hyalella azteca]